MAGYEIDEIRRIRREISALFDHDVGKLIAHYQVLEKEYRKSGKYKFLANTNLWIHPLRSQKP